MSAERTRMVSDVRLIQDALPGLVGMDSLTYILGHLIGQDAITLEAWERAMTALEEEHLGRHKALEAHRNRKPWPPPLHVAEWDPIPSVGEEPTP